MSAKVASAIAALIALALIAPTTANAQHIRRPQATVAAVTAPRGPGSEEGSEWPRWDNVVAYGAPENSAIADCTFAAVADWEMIAGYGTPDKLTLIKAFFHAGGTEEGLEDPQWERWMLVHGVNGVRIRLVERPLSWLDALIQRHKAVIAVMGSHALVVAGFNAIGPEVITYGETRQETWREWHEIAEELFVPVVVS